LSGNGLRRYGGTAGGSPGVGRCGTARVERVLARFGLIPYAPPVFTARAPLAGLLLGLPGLAGTGLLQTAHEVYAGLPNGFYSLDAMLCEGVFRPAGPGRRGGRDPGS